MRVDVPGPTTRFRHSHGRLGNRRQPLSSAVAGGTTGGQERPFPHPLLLWKWKTDPLPHWPNYPHTGLQRPGVTHLSKFPGPKGPRSPVKR